MKALHIISGDLWAGAETQVLELVTTLRDKANVDACAVVFNEGELSSRLLQQGVQVTVLPERNLNPMKILLQLRRLIAQSHPDVVHTHKIKENILGSIAATWAGGVPSVRTVHGANERPIKGPSGAFQRLLRNVDRSCGRHLQKKLIAVSADLAETLALEYPRDRIAIIRNGIDPEKARAAARQRVGLRTDGSSARHIGFAGRLVPIKRVDLFLACAATLRARYPDQQWRFHVIGDGPLRTALESDAANLGLASEVRFHGHRTDSVACLADLDLLLICSDHEGLPMVLLEALAVGTPVVAHNVGGISELAQSNSAVCLVREQQPEAYASAVRAMLGAHSAGSAGLGEEYNSTVNAKAIAEIYRAVVDAHAASRRQGAIFS